jgi:CRISPR/Cas system-associated exonuclease Cas4 (RecB family)
VYPILVQLTRLVGDVEVAGSEIDLDGVTVRGFLDSVKWWPSLGVPVIEDLKTGSPDEDADTRQLDIYALAAREQYGIDVQYARYWYTKLDRRGEWHRMDKPRDQIVEEYRRLDQIIQQKLFLPNPGKICGICEVKPWCPIQGWLKSGEEYRSA